MVVICSHTSRHPPLFGFFRAHFKTLRKSDIFNNRKPFKLSTIYN